jgi:hypothetical protein
MLRARSAPVLDEPKANRAVISAFAAVSPLYLRLILRFRKIAFIDGERLVRAFGDFQEGGNRLLIAFRHPYGDEPQLLAHAFARLLPREARRRGSPLRKTAHAIFVHGYEVPLWSGPLVRWLLPRAGAIPVHHVKFDSKGIGRIVGALKDGDYPLALAPEGQVSYTSSTVPRLEQGFARIAFWTAEALMKEGRSERTMILPLSVHYHYGKNANRTLERMLGMLEADCGLAGTAGEAPSRRLRAAAEAIVAMAERFYSDSGRPPSSPPGVALKGRWSAVVEAALQSGEKALNLPSDGSVEHRFYRIRQEGWDRIYRTDLDGMAPLARSLADRAAGEAWYAMRHMETADIGAYLDFDADLSDAATDDLVETAANYWDLTSRLRGGNISDRLRFFNKDAYLVVGEPLEVGERLSAYQIRRKEALRDLTAELANRFRDSAQAYTAYFTKERQHGEP